jgi:membrane protease subunit HflK
MAWNKNSGGRGSQGGNQGPWGNPSPGSGGGGRRGDQPPDLEEIVRQGRERLRRLLPRGAPGGSLLGLLAIGLGGLWLASGVYQVNAREQGVVLRFGKFTGATTAPGLRWHLPWPIETAQMVNVTDARKVEIGGQVSDQAGTASGHDESLMLTSDRNFLEVKFVVQFDVKNAKDFLFNVKDPDEAVRTSAQAAMREVVGRGKFDLLQTEQRTTTAEEVKRLVQTSLDSYNAGVRVLDINLQSVDPPGKALEAARDVQTARQEKEKMRNLAEAYRNNIIPQARGKAERAIQEAQGYKQKVIADAQGETQRFLSVYEQYRKAPDVTRKRMYLETMEKVLGGTNKVIIDRAAQGVVPYLPLNELKPGRGPAPAANPPAGPSLQPGGGN